MDSHQMPVAGTAVAAGTGVALSQQWLLICGVLVTMVILALLIRIAWRRNRKLNDR